MDKIKILLALKEGEEARAFRTYFSGLGLDSAQVHDGARALELALQETPSAIIVDTELPVIGGERLFQILRHNPHTSNIPFLFLSDRVHDVKGFRTGVDIYLIRPVNLEEAHSRLRQALAARQAPLGSKEIEGRLSQMSLADIIQFLHLNRKEGELKLSSGESAGSVFIKDGAIHNAVCGGVEKEKALFRLLEWTDGKFEFIPKSISASKKIRASTGNLLMEGMRQIDEFRKKEAQFPSKKTALKAKVDPAALPKGLQPIIYDIVQLAHSHPKVGDVIERCQYPDYEVYSALCGLLAKGVIEEERSAIEAHRDEFLTTDQMISIREKIMSRFADLTGLNYGKILIVSTSGELVAEFLKECRKIPGFAVNTRSAFPEISMINPLGEVASFKLYGGMDLILFSIPTVAGMGPLWRAFSANMVGLVLMWDEEGAAMLEEISSSRNDLLQQRRVPVVYVHRGRPEDARWRKALGLKMDDHLFRLDSGKDAVSEIFYSLFGNLIKEDYAAC